MMLGDTAKDLKGRMVGKNKAHSWEAIWKAKCSNLATPACTMAFEKA